MADTERELREELNVSRQHVVALEAFIRRALEIIEPNYIHQREKVKDGISILHGAQGFVQDRSDEKQLGASNVNDYSTVMDARMRAISAVRRNMTRDDACNAIVPSDLRLLIGAIDAKDNRIAALEVAVLGAKVLLENENPDVGGAIDALHDTLHARG